MYCVYLLIKARNRFKKEKITDIGELSARLFGEWTKPYMQMLLVFTNSMFLILYMVFFGNQLDQLFCQTAKIAECGHDGKYAMAVSVILLPIVYQREMKNIGIFSMISLTMTFISIGLIFYMSL